MITLRQLELDDAPFMLEWMADPNITHGFQKRMKDLQMEDVRRFIVRSAIPEELVTGTNLHYAIDEAGEYLGTISLKNIDITNGTAEYAIVVRKKAQGNGTAYVATMKLLEKAFFEIGLRRVYLNVLYNNDSAINLYEKCGFVFEGELRKHIVIDGKYMNLKLYGYLKEEYKKAE